MQPADVLTEGNVSECIMSFSRQEFLYTGTVCKAWRKNYADPTTATNLLRAFQSVSSVQEAVESGINTVGLFDLAVVFRAGISILQALFDMGVTYCHDSTRYYAAYTGNLPALALLYSLEFCDECDIFEAVRGGHLDVVQYTVENMLPATDDIAVNEIPEWRTSVYDNAFIKRCMFIANTCGKPGIGEMLNAYVEDRYFRPVRERSLNSVDLALAKNRLDIVQVLRRVGGSFRGDTSLRFAVNTGNADLVRYLEQEGCAPEGGLLSDYLIEIPDSLEYIEYLLQNKRVEVDTRTIDLALSLRRNSVVDLLLKFGAPVADITIDRAIAEWDFERARSLMASHGCRPTHKAYFWLFSQGVDADLMLGWCAGDLQLDFDDVYLEGLELIFSANNYALPLGFGSFRQMWQNRVWSVLLQCMSSEVVQWFKDRMPDDMEVEE